MLCDQCPPRLLESPDPVPHISFIFKYTNSVMNGTVTPPHHALTNRVFYDTHR